MKSNKPTSNKSRSLRSKKSKSKKNTKKVNKHVMKGGSLNPGSSGSSNSGSPVSGLVQQVAEEAKKLQSTEAEAPPKNLNQLLKSLGSNKSIKKITNTSTISPTINYSRGLPRQGNPFTQPSGDEYLKTRLAKHPYIAMSKRSSNVPLLRRAVKYSPKDPKAQTNYSSPHAKSIKRTKSQRSKVPLG